MDETITKSQTVSLLAPLWMRVVSIFLIIGGILGVITSFMTAGMTVLFLTGGGASLLGLSLLIQALNVIPSILYIISGFGLRQLKKWSLTLFIAIVVLTIGRVLLRMSNGTTALTNLVEPALILCLLAACRRKIYLFS